MLTYPVGTHNEMFAVVTASHMLKGLKSISYRNSDKKSTGATTSTVVCYTPLALRFTRCADVCCRLQNVATSNKSDMFYKNHTHKLYYILGNCGVLLIYSQTRHRWTEEVGIGAPTSRRRYSLSSALPTYPSGSSRPLNWLQLMFYSPSKC